jgi:diguanylate cyclase (GGDEF)-like protein
MVEAEQELNEAIQTGKIVARDQRRRLSWNLGIAASYALDTLFLAFFASAGTIPGTIALAYGAAAAVLTGGVYAITASGWNLKLRDPSMVETTTFLSVGMQLGVVAAAPQVAFPFLANLFTVFSFGMIWLSLRDSLVVWSLGIAATAILFYTEQGRLGVPVSSAFELALVWLYFSLILGRCLLLSVNANEMRARLADGRRKLSESLAQVQQLASHDELTHALNRRALVSSLERERARAERSGVPFSIGMMDLDHFKSVNDMHGHGAGDEVLRGFAATVHDTMRVTDVFGRYGGEEFLIVLVGTELPAALEALERVRAALQQRDWDGAAPGLVLTVSAGVASFRKGETVEQLLHRADQALYQAKNAGRNRIVESKP